MADPSDPGGARTPGSPVDPPSDGLALALAFVLCQHGWPSLDEAQRLELRMHLAHLRHGRPGTPCPGRSVT